MSLGPIEKIAIACAVGVGAWHFAAPSVPGLGSHAHGGSRSPASIAPASGVVQLNSAQAELSAHFPAVGAAMLSRTNDPCHVIKSHQTDHPPGYPPGTFVSELVLYCSGAQGNYVLNNRGVYRGGQLISSSRTRVDDGECYPLVLKKRPARRRSKPGEKLVEGVAVFHCMKMGQPIFEEMSAVYDSAGNPVWGERRELTVAQVQADVAENTPAPIAKTGGHP